MAATTPAKKARHKSFGTRKNVEESLSFGLLDDSYTFECKPIIQGAVLLDFVSSATDDDANAAARLVEFINTALLNDEERDRFTRVIRSDKVEDTIEMEELGDIVAWLVEQYTTRPTR